MIGAAMIGANAAIRKLSVMQATQLVIRDNNGGIVPSASVSVYICEEDGTDGALADLFDDFGDPITNPFDASITGVARFKAAAGRYNIVSTSGAFEARWNEKLIGNAAGRDTGALEDHLPLFQDIPSGGGGGSGVGPSVILTDAAPQLTVQMAIDGSVVLLSDGSDGLLFWDMDFGAGDESGLLFVMNVTGSPVPLNPDAKSNVYIATGKTHIAPMGTILVVLLKAQYHLCLVTGDTIAVP